MPTDQEYAVMASAVYGGVSPNVLEAPPGWSMALFDNGLASFGFKYGVFMKGDEVVIAYAGTDPGAVDWVSNAVIGAGLPVPTQLEQAAVVFAAVTDYVQAQNSNATISFTGHSLGGGLASVMAVWFDKPAVVFAPAPFENAVRGEFAPLIRLSMIMRLYTTIGAGRCFTADVYGFRFRHAREKRTELCGHRRSPGRHHPASCSYDRVVLDADRRWKYAYVEYRQAQHGSARGVDS